MKYQITTKNILGNSLKKGESYRIVGAGISGLLLGYYLKKNHIPFQIYEKAAIPGGLIKTHRLEGLGLVEQAANGFVWCKELADLCEDIEIEIQSPDAASKARYLVRNKELKKFPLGIMEAIGMASRLMIPHSQTLETVEDFGKTFFGNTFTNQILEPAFAGIYGAPISELSFNGVLKPFAEQLNTTNSLPKAIYRWRKQAKSPDNAKKRSGTQSFKGGFGQFPIKLAEYLKDHIHYNHEIKDITSEPTVITAPADVFQHFFKGGIHQHLANIRYTPMVSTTIFFKKEDVSRFKAGFGCLIPRNENLTLLGVLFNSCIFPDRVEDDGLISLTCMFRDYEGNLINQSDEDIVNNVLLPDLKELLGVNGQPQGYKVSKWHKGIPIYTNDLMESWSAIDDLLKKDYPNVRLLGNYTGQISVRGMAQFIAKQCLEIN